jgi:hypothetical protein
MVGEHLPEQLIGHISRDAAAIEGNEKPADKNKKAEAKEGTKEESKKRGRPKKGEIREDKKEDKRLNIQVNQTPSEALKDIPTVCDVGCKKNAQGYKETWIGYKLHVDTADNGLPITALLTSASLHDSQVAIPMMKMTTDRVTYLYDLINFTPCGLCRSSLFLSFWLVQNLSCDPEHSEGFRTSGNECA